MFENWMGYFALGQDLTIGMVLWRFFIALLISSVIGIDREIKNRPAGMRTHVLVCIGAMLIAVVEDQIIANVVALNSPQINVSVGRLTGTIVSGVGFLGAGTIIFSDRKIMGLTTAASLWCTACIGVACGFGYTTFALIAGVVVFAILKLMNKIINVHPYKKLEVCYINREETQAFLTAFFEEQKATILDVDFHAEQEKDQILYTNIYTISLPSNKKYTEIIEALSEKESIRGVSTRNV